MDERAQPAPLGFAWQVKGADGVITRLSPIIFVIGVLLCGLSVLLILPIIADLVTGSPTLGPFVISLVITTFFGVAFLLAARQSRDFALDVRQAFILTAASWLVLSSFSALPFLGIGVDFTDAYFETVSGLKTTGSTVLTGLDTMSPGILLWRSELQWAGGVGIVVMAIVLLPFLRVGGMQLFRTESSDNSERIVPNAFSLMSWIIGIYAGLTILCALGYIATGMSTFDAICHAMTTLSTGGYSTHDASFGFFEAPAAEWIAIVFMLAGAVPFVMYIRFLQGDRAAPVRDPQAKSLVLFVVVVALITALWLVPHLHDNFGHAFRSSLFHIVSIVTTTGYATTDYTLWGPFVVGIFFMLMFVGGCAGSTAGSIKIYRHQVIFVVIRTQLLRLSGPHRVARPQYNGAPIPADVPSSVLAFIALFFVLVGLFTVALTAYGLDLVTALSASATAMANVGPGFGDVIGPAGNFQSLPAGAKWLLSFEMLLGRLEIFTLLLMLDPQFWRR